MKSPDAPGKDRQGPLPPSYFVAALAAMVVLAVLVPCCRVFSFPWNLLGLVPLLAGGVLNLVADRQFKVAGTTVKPFEPSSMLVTDGVFRVTRNPMYLGMACALVGVATLLRESTPWIVPPAFAVAVFFRFIRPEEVMLGERFGEEWQAYARRVRRWI